MQVKEIWITQKRKVDIPWALHVTAYKKGRRIRADCELYAEWINTASRKILIYDTVFKTNKPLIETVSDICEKMHNPLSYQDKAQIEEELNDLRDSFKY